MKLSYPLLIVALAKFCIDPSVAASLVVLGLIAFESLLQYWHNYKINQASQDKILELEQKIADLTTSISTLKLERSKPGAFIPAGRI